MEDSSKIGHAFKTIMVIGDMKTKQRGACFLDLCDEDQSILKGKYEALHSNNGSRMHENICTEIDKLYSSRRKSYSGAYYSFLGKLEAAENLFQQGHESLHLETSPEMKLHRLFWYAEHKTRMQDWAAAQELLDDTQAVFHDSWANSEFIQLHFPDRKETLSMAIRENTSIDVMLPRMEKQRQEALQATMDVSSPADSPMSTHSEWLYPQGAEVDYMRAMFDYSMLSVSPLHYEDWAVPSPPPLSLSPGLAASPVQPGTPTGDFYIFDPKEKGNGKTKEAQTEAETESPAQTEAGPAIQAPSPVVFPTTSDTMMDLFPEQ